MKKTGPANSFEERLVSLICSHVEKLENEEIERLNKKIKNLEGEVDEYEIEMDFMDHGDHRRCPWCGHFSKETNPSCNGVATDCIWFVPCKKWCIKEVWLQIFVRNARKNVFATNVPFVNLVVNFSEFFYRISTGRFAAS